MHCKHEKCNCQGTDVQQDGYCSENCRKSGASHSDKCECGHADCQ